jgi:hypothetical protein
MSIDPNEQLPKVLDLLRAVAWKFWRRSGVDFDELMSEAYFAFMRACETYKGDRGAKFSTWCQYKTSMHLTTYLTKRFNDRLVFVEEIVDEMLPVQYTTALRNSLYDQTKDLSPEARKLIQLLVDSPQTDLATPAQVLREACEELAYEGYDAIHQKIIIHEIKAGIGK